MGVESSMLLLKITRLAAVFRKKVVNESKGCKMLMKGWGLVRHPAGMRVVWCFLLLCVPCLGADESADRVAIERAISGLNEFRLAAPFTQDSSALDELKRLPNVAPLKWRDLGPGCKPTVKISHEPWGEATIGCQFETPRTVEMLNPRISGGAVTFITPDVALSEGSWTYDNGSTQQTIPLFFVLKKEGAEWKIASLRILAPR